MAPPERARRSIGFWVKEAAAAYGRQRLRCASSRIERLIYLIRGQRVMLSSDLAMLYGVVTWRLHEQVKRNQARFPDDFVFQLHQKKTKL